MAASLNSLGSTIRQCTYFMTAVILVMLCAGCDAKNSAKPSGSAGQSVTTVQPTAARTSFPPMGPPLTIEPGVEVREGEVDGLKVWLYTPAGKQGESLPVVLIAPAGTSLFHGIGLADGDRAEHLPYVRAGFAVVAYEVAGFLPDNPSDQEIITAAEAFMKAEGGLKNARDALNYALQEVPAVDRDRIYCAGHSSAATISLLVAASESRIRGCIAYAAVADLQQRLGPGVSGLDMKIPGFQAFVQRASPMNRAADLRCPIFLFHAMDDSNVPISETDQFAAELRRNNASLTFVRASSGDHYDSMIHEGIPKAIEWLKILPAGG